jgi:hypothetical protein
VNASPGFYHQETVGSGQQFNGNLRSGVGVGISGVVDARRLIVLDLAALYPGEGEQHANNSALLLRLSFDQLLAPRFNLGSYPTRTPPGWGRCGDVGGLSIVYCDRAGRELVLQQAWELAEPESGRVLDGPGFQLWSLSAPEERQRWRIDRGASTYGVIDAPAQVSSPAIVDMLASIPLFHPGLLNPASGSGDLRAEINDDLLVALVGQIEGASASVEDGYPAPLNAVVFRWRGHEGRMTVYPVAERFAGMPAFVVGLQDGLFEIDRIGAIDVVVKSFFNDLAGQTFFRCGQLEWNLRPQGWPLSDWRPFLGALIDVLPCAQ